MKILKIRDINLTYRRVISHTLHSQKEKEEAIKQLVKKIDQYALQCGAMMAFVVNAIVSALLHYLYNGFSAVNWWIVVLVPFAAAILGVFWYFRKKRSLFGVYHFVFETTFDVIGRIKKA